MIAVSATVERLDPCTEDEWIHVHLQPVSYSGDWTEFEAEDDLRERLESAGEIVVVVAAQEV